MPIISVFFGIIVRMFYKEHEPVHFHAEYQGQQGKFDFDGNMIAGNIHSRTALRLIKDWAALHQQELRNNWESLKKGHSINSIEPLQ